MWPSVRLARPLEQLCRLLESLGRALVDWFRDLDWPLHACGVDSRCRLVIVVLSQCAIVDAI